MNQFSRETHTRREKVYHDEENKKKSGPQVVDLNKVDMIALKHKGLSIEKISKMLNAPEALIEKQINFHESYRIFSGVY